MAQSVNLILKKLIFNTEQKCLPAHFIIHKHLIFNAILSICHSSYNNAKFKKLLGCGVQKTLFNNIVEDGFIKIVAN